MPLIPSAQTASSRRFAAWAIGPWVVLLLGAFGGVQYLQHAEYLCLAASLLVITVCAACILRQPWSRRAMQMLALLLTAWSLVTAVLMLRQSGSFEIARQHAHVVPQLREMTLWMIARAERTWQVGLALKLLAIPALLWLAWQLESPAVRAQFRSRGR